MLLLYGLLLFMIIGAVIALETKDLLSSVISLGAVGFALSILFLLLGAPDLAIIQVVVEIISLILLLRLVVEREDVTIAHRYRYGDVFSTSSGLIFIGVFIVVAAVVLRYLPAFGEPVMKVSQHYLTKGFSETNIPNVVTAILLDFRAYDTLGEATVIFTSIVGALVILRKRGRTDYDRDDSNS